MRKGLYLADNQSFGINYYLSLVVVYVEEGVIVRQFDHLEGMFCGFVNDGQVEKPVRKKKKKKGRERLVEIVFIKKKK